MKEKFKTLINNKNLIIILIITLIISIGTTGTYAWFTWSNPNNTTLSMTIGNIDVMFDTGNNINITTVTPVLYPEEGSKAIFSLKKKNASLSSIAYTITLDITTISNELKSTDFKWALMTKDTTSVISEGNFSTASNGSSITIYTGILIDTSTISYDLYIYINGNSENSSNMMNKTLTGTINITGHEEENPALAEIITNLYNNANKTVVNAPSHDSEGNITTINYNYANIYDTDTTSGGLMNDRLGGTTENYNSGNVRYYGASPNNYVYFNCSDYSNQSPTTCELWRIIGVFNGKVKIMRNKSIGKYSWDNKDTTTGAETDNGKNDWTTARLMKLLNSNNYYTIDSNDNGYGQSLYYNAQSGTCFGGRYNATISCDFTSTGLKNDTTRNMISEEIYHLRGHDFTAIYANEIYNYERTTGSVYTGRQTSWSGKIAIPYASDYGYATDLSLCSQTLKDYDKNSNCIDNNWMKEMLEEMSSNDGFWLLNSHNNNTSGVTVIYSDSKIYNQITFSTRDLFPVLYLNTNTKISNVSNTSGSLDNPYKLSV